MMKTNIRTISNIFNLSPKSVSFYHVGARDKGSVEIAIIGSCNTQPNFDISLVVNPYDFNKENVKQYKGISGRVMTNFQLGILGRALEKNFSEHEQAQLDMAGLQLTAFAEGLINSANASSNIINYLYRIIDPNTTVLKVGRITYREDEVCELFIDSWDLNGISANTPLLTVICNLRTGEMKVKSALEPILDPNYYKLKPVSAEFHCNTYDLDFDEFKKIMLEYMNIFDSQN